MTEIWDKHGPPAFVTLAAAHLDNKKRKRKVPPKPQSDQPQTNSETGNLEELAQMLGANKKGKPSSGKVYF